MPLRNKWQAVSYLGTVAKIASEWTPAIDWSLY